MSNYDVAVIGAGPGGYVCAIRLAQLGKKTVLIEKRETLGGTCLNIGCVPSKALLEASAKYHLAKNGLEDFGVKVKEVSFDLNAMMQRKEEIVSESVAGVAYLMKKNKIDVVTGSARFLSPHEIEVGEDKIQAESIVIATGSAPVELPSMKFDGKKIISSDEALSLSKVPEHLIIIGAGVIGVEMASVWKRLGAKVSIVEMLPRAVAGADVQISKFMERVLKAEEIDVYLDTKVEEVDSGEKVKIKASKGEKTMELEGDVLLVAAGRKAFTEDLGLDMAGVEVFPNGKIRTDSNFQTNVKNIYAIGDVIDGPMLAHKASEEGVAVAEIIAGQSGHVNYEAIPSVVYTEPEAAWVGYTEEQLKEKGVEFSSGRFFFKANARAKAMNQTDGFVKVLADKKTDKLLGVHIIGPKASELIAEATVALEHKASAEDLGRIVHAHPTLSESVKESALAAEGWSIHS